MATTPNPELIQHGILDENSDVRAHVGVLARTVYVFRTRDGRKAIEDHPELSQRAATQPGVNGATASGIAMPIEFIPGVKRVDCSRNGWQNWHGWDGWTENLSTTDKGRRAAELIEALLGAGRIPLWVQATDDCREAVQIKGTDIVVFVKQKLQVKCDYRAGPKAVQGCTGNLYLQTAERNPRKLH